MMEMNLYWFGMLTHKNAARVAELLTQLLGGERFSTAVSNEFYDYKPSLRTCQILNTKDGDPISVSRSDSGSKRTYVSIHDSYGLWSFDTELEEDRYDPDFNNPYFVFECNKVTITTRTPNGSRFYVVFMVEEKGGHPYH